MKKYILLTILAFYSLSATAQTRKYIGNFSQVRPYYNPSLTGQEGSQLKTVYRNQWTGFEDAPRTIFASAEFNLSDFKKSKGYQLNNGTAYSTDMQHSLGLLLLRESFGPYSETQANLSYSSVLRLSEKFSLRWGGALTYTLLALDGNKLTVDQENDPKYIRLLGQHNRGSKMDLNLGLTLEAKNFYLSYAMQDVTEGKMIKSGDEFMDEMYARRHVGLAGYRTALADDLGLVLNTIYQHDKQAEATIEGQLKAVYHNMLWAGAGYRNNLAFTATAGIKINKLQISYLYESPVADAATIDKPSNEITLVYQLRGRQSAAPQKQVLLW
ncbi:PorP/SprF family type IX secretion system membrane protein [Pontibacter pudoricolor]|uniref:PorP/SprF family type IX secretion system membrane protein n=1 Tax=Pontibacter pudoricolor TaxID=2694930 RepID=UPI001391392A|nr:PorP/SprF family type IX secretion system membrane protein [Pontibacter pudoricolor]